MRYALLFCVLFVASGTSLAQAPAAEPQTPPAADDPQASAAERPAAERPAAERPAAERSERAAAERSERPAVERAERPTEGSERPAAEPQAAASQVSSLGMSILGNQEAPKSLVIVPWKGSEIGSGVGVSRALDTRIRAVDKEVFMRELKYYEIRSEGAK